MIDLDDIKRRFKATDYWNKYHSDIILEVNLVLTEPVCPQATIRCRDRAIQAAWGEVRHPAAGLHDRAGEQSAAAR